MVLAWNELWAFEDMREGQRGWILGDDRGETGRRRGWGTKHEQLMLGLLG